MLIQYLNKTEEGIPPKIEKISEKNKLYSAKGVSLLPLILLNCQAKPSQAPAPAQLAGFS